MSASASPITLAQLLKQEQLPPSIANRIVSGIELDSRKLEKNYIFIALNGAKLDGRTFIPDALTKQVCAILIEGETFLVEYEQDIPVITIPKLRPSVSYLSARFYREPSQIIRITGVTGTNGKTTCTLLLAQLSAQLLGSSSVMGTTGYGILDAKSLTPLSQQITLLHNTGLTTPDPVSVQKILAELRDAGAVYSAIEVSSHSLDQFRVAGVQFYAAIFTNLTQDHLDYHGSLESYGIAKAKLLSMPNLSVAIFNNDDAWARELVKSAPPSVKTYTYGINTPADVMAIDVVQHAKGTTAFLQTPWGSGHIQSPFMGLFNMGNLLAVIAAACAQGADFNLILALIPSLTAAPGRMQAISVEASAQDIQVIVDYAHTPDALENTLKAIHEHNTGHVWTVFGCGGDRDKTKRPLMGRIAEKLSDYVIVTNDNPRSEDPALIAADIVKGLQKPAGCLVIANREQAIDFAIQQAKPEDIILIAGKGHEDYQIFADRTVPFSDSQHARLSIQRRLVKRDNANEEFSQ